VGKLAAAAAVCVQLMGDAASYCRAIEYHDPAFCYSITDPNFRTACRAEVERHPDLCTAIADFNQRMLCQPDFRNSK